MACRRTQSAELGSENNARQTGPRSAMRRLWFTNEVDGDRAERVGRRPSNVYLPQMQEGSAAPHGQFGDRGMARADTLHQRPTWTRGHLRDSRRAHDSEANLIGLVDSADCRDEMKPRWQHGRMCICAVRLGLGKLGPDFSEMPELIERYIVETGPANILVCAGTWTLSPRQRIPNPTKNITAATESIANRSLCLWTYPYLI